MGNVMISVFKGHYGINHSVKNHLDPSTHAEIDALNKVITWKNRPKKMDLLVIRVSPTGILGESRPCFHCLKKIMLSGVNVIDVYYSTSNGTIIREKIKDMLKSEIVHISFGAASVLAKKAK